MRRTSLLALLAAGVAGSWTLLTAGCACESADGSSVCSCCVPPSAAADCPAARRGDMIGRDRLKEIGLRPYWQVDLGLKPGEKVSHACLLNDTVAVVTDQNIAYAVDGHRGTWRVLAKVAPSGEVTAPSFDGERYFFVGDSEAVGVNRGGEIDVSIRTKAPPSTPAISDKNYIYIGAMTGETYAYSLKSKVMGWKDKIGPSVTGLGLSKANLIIARSDVRNGIGELTSVRTQYWKQNWQRTVDGVISAPIVCTPEAIFVACEDRSLYCFDSDQGLVNWQVRTPSLLRDSPTVLADRVIQIVPGDGTWVVSRADGQMLWKDPARLTYLGQIAERMYFLSGNDIVVKQAADGKTLGGVPATVRGKITAVPNPDGDKLFLVGAGGQVVCCNDLDQPFLTIDHVRGGMPPAQTVK